jgi:hypothetical protein
MRPLVVVKMEVNLQMVAQVGDPLVSTAANL